MSDPQATADRVEIEAIRGEFTDAVMMCDHDRLASLFTPDGAARNPRQHRGRPGGDPRHGRRREALADNFVQTTHPPTPRSGTTSMKEAMNSAPATGESNE
jgi:hypothetical protein